MVRTQIYIPETIYEDAKLYADHQKVSVSHLLRQGLELRLAQIKTQRVGNPLDGLVGRFKSQSNEDAWKKHDDIYR